MDIDISHILNEKNNDEKNKKISDLYMSLRDKLKNIKIKNIDIEESDIFIYFNEIIHKLKTDTHNLFVIKKSIINLHIKNFRERNFWNYRDSESKKIIDETEFIINVKNHREMYESEKYELKTKRLKFFEIFKTSFFNSNDKNNLESDYIKKEISDYIKSNLEECSKNLNHIENKVILLYYTEKITQKKIGDIVKLTRSRVSQILKASKQKMRKFFEEKKINYDNFRYD